MSRSTKEPDRDPVDWADPARTYDTLAGAYADEFLDELDRKPFDRDLLTRYAGAVLARPALGRPLCDLGCGPGHIGAFLAGLGVEVRGIDVSSGMVAEATRRFPHLAFSQGDMTDLPLPDGAFCGIACFYALIHIPRQQVPVALAEMYRVLSPAAPLLIAVHGGEGSLHATEMVDRPANLDATLFSLEELTDHLGAAGFEIVERHARDPYANEHPTQRLYVWAKRPG